MVRAGELRMTNSTWMVTKKIPLSVVIIVILTIGGFVWWGAEITGNVKTIQEWTDKKDPII